MTRAQSEIIHKQLILKDTILNGVSAASVTIYGNQKKFSPTFNFGKNSDVRGGNLEMNNW